MLRSSCTTLCANRPSSVCSPNSNDLLQLQQQAGTVDLQHLFMVSLFLASQAGHHFHGVCVCVCVCVCTAGWVSFGRVFVHYVLRGKSGLGRVVVPGQSAFDA
jgi:hypothetical protein